MLDSLAKNLSLSSKLAIKEFLAIFKERASRNQAKLSADRRHLIQKSDAQRCIIVFDERIPSPDRDAGSLRMLMILKTLAEWSHVVFVPFNRPHGLEYEEALWKVGVETADVVEYRRLLKE